MSVRSHPDFFIPTAFRNILLDRIAPENAGAWLDDDGMIQPNAIRGDFEILRVMRVGVEERETRRGGNDPSFGV